MSDVKSLTLKEWAFGTEAKPYTLVEVDTREESCTFDGSDHWQTVLDSRFRATVEALERAKMGEQVAYENYHNAAEELARVTAERDAARAEARVQNIACAEEMLSRDHMQQNWDAMVNGVKFAHERAEKAEAERHNLEIEVSSLRAQLDLLKEMNASDLRMLRSAEGALDKMHVRVELLEQALTGITEEFERTVNHIDNKGRGGQHVPFHGDFAAACQLPSFCSRARWWATHLRDALKETE
jgi:hypothetical protein